MKIKEINLRSFAKEVIIPKEQLQKIKGGDIVKNPSTSSESK